MKTLAPLALLAPLLGCVASSGAGVASSEGGCKGAGCTRASVASRGGTNGSGSSAGSGSSSTSTSSGSSSGSAGASTGTTGTSSASAGGSSGSSGSSGSTLGCGMPSLPDAGGCPGGSYVSALVDTVTCAPIAGATVQALDANGTPLSGAVTSAADGTFVLCGPSGPFTPSFMAPSYATSFRSEVAAGSHLSLNTSSMYSNDLLGVITSFAPGGYDRSLGTIIALIGVSSNCPDRSGFSLSLTDADGGALPDGGYLEAYLDAAGLPDATLTATSSQGLALFYDIDLSTTTFFSVAWSSPDAGNCAPVLQTPEASLTGRVFVSGNALSNDILPRL